MRLDVGMAVGGEEMMWEERDKWWVLRGRHIWRFTIYVHLNGEI